MITFLKLLYNYFKRLCKNGVVVYTGEVDEKSIKIDMSNPKNKFTNVNLKKVPDPEICCDNPGKPIILIVDDQPTSIILLKMAFKDIKLRYGLDIHKDYHVVFATGAKAGTIAYKFIKENKIDIAILDITLGEIVKGENDEIVEIDGADLGIILHESQPCCNTVFLTAHSLNRNNDLLTYYYTRYEQLTKLNIEDSYLSKNDDNKAETIYNLIQGRRCV